MTNMIKQTISLFLLLPLIATSFGIEPAEIRSLDNANVHGKRNILDDESIAVFPYEIFYEPVLSYDKRSSSPLVRFGKRSSDLKDGSLITRELRASMIDSPLVRFGKRSPSGPLVRFGRSPAVPLVRFGRSLSGPLVRFGKRNFENLDSQYDKRSGMSPLIRFGRASAGPLVRFGKRSVTEEDEFMADTMEN
ncbi:Hypothetical protein SRAE_X000047400 [Strongyloides ratti]|uniref:Uncharacterized protein n=1 Tax=Strongyloides ratti TaxID=34506 RepID=A0A090LSG1_STRRB|nr:Hypothetical protein SRAE_X000047400 [Strongyloides ratti]CEF71147.1 Hypothetical protein SRAE_X000047400 [Strongyloides ratti]